MVDLPYFDRIRPEPGKRAAWAMAVAVHAMLAIFLFYGIRWQSMAPESVSVDLVRYQPPSKIVKPTVAPPQEKKPPEPLPQKVEKKEPPPPPKAEIMRKAPEKKKIIPKKTEPRRDPITKMLQLETDRMMKNRVADAVNREQEQIKANQAAAARDKGLADYLAKIRGKIRGKIFLPPSISSNPESEFIVAQLPSGEVLSVKLKTSSGNSVLDAAVERAIHQASPLPKPDDPSLFQREIVIKYRPLED